MKGACGRRAHVIGVHKARFYVASWPRCPHVPLRRITSHPGVCVHPFSKGPATLTLPSGHRLRTASCCRAIFSTGTDDIMWLDRWPWSSNLSVASKLSVLSRCLSTTHTFPRWSLCSKNRKLNHKGNAQLTNLVLCGCLNLGCASGTSLFVCVQLGVHASFLQSDFQSCGSQRTPDWLCTGVPGSGSKSQHGAERLNQDASADVLPVGCLLCECHARHLVNACILITSAKWAVLVQPVSTPDDEKGSAVWSHQTQG